MDLSDPDVLRSSIRSIFDQEAARTFVGFAGVPDSALEPLIAPGLNWAGDLRDVDPERLRDAIRTIINGLNDPARPRQAIDRAAIARALRGSECHYLWFC
jgi:hypothetical protein